MAKRAVVGTNLSPYCFRIHLIAVQGKLSGKCLLVNCVYKVMSIRHCDGPTFESVEAFLNGMDVIFPASNLGSAYDTVTADDARAERVDSFGFSSVYHGEWGSSGEHREVLEVRVYFESGLGIYIGIYMEIDCTFDRETRCAVGGDEWG